MALVTLRNIRLGFGGPALLDGVDLAVEPGERVCLIGRNGTGKSTLLKVLSGELQPDDGEVVCRQGANVARLVQEVPEDAPGTVFDVVAEGLGEVGSLLADYHEVSHRLAAGEHGLLSQLERIQHQLESAGGWQLDQRVETVLSKLSLDGDAAFAGLSGGLKRRVTLARALVRQPDLLLLDEPTNHLDIDAIAWLEEFLAAYDGTLLFITHDRAFLRRLATRIVELDRGRLTSYPGNYDTYLRNKEAALAAEEHQNAEFDKALAREETWIRQGIKARRTRNEGRVRALKQMREQRKARRERLGEARLQLAEAERSGKLVVEARDVSFGYGDRPVIRHLSTTILRGDKVGIIGPNGAGKSTLLKLLLGQLEPDAGSIRFGTRLEVAYFDQHRSRLDPDATVLDTVAEGREQVDIGGRQRHVISYLQDFLFSPDRCRSPVRSLSGGERNRLLLARLFLQPANALVMDEPTNDLDVETLELLESLLVEYAGTLLLVSHDRAFLDNVVTSTLAFEGEGRVNDYVGGYEDWLRQRAAPPVTSKKASKPADKPKPVAAEKPRTRKLSYKEQRELEALPGHIESLETEQAELQQRMADPAFYQQDREAIAEATSRLEALEQELAAAYGRWETLEAE